MSAVRLADQIPLTTNEGIVPVKLFLAKFLSTKLLSMSEIVCCQLSKLTILAIESIERVQTGLFLQNRYATSPYHIN